MQIRYRVHSCVQVSVPAVVQYGGQDIATTLAGLCVELVEIDGGDTLTRRFIPEDIEAAKALFPVDGVVVATLTLEPAE